MMMMQRHIQYSHFTVRFISSFLSLLSCEITKMLHQPFTEEMNVQRKFTFTLQVMFTVQICPKHSSLK